MALDSNAFRTWKRSCYGKEKMATHSVHKKACTSLFLSALGEWMNKALCSLDSMMLGKWWRCTYGQFSVSDKPGETYLTLFKFKCMFSWLKLSLVVCNLVILGGSTKLQSMESSLIFFSLNKHLLSTFYVPGTKLGTVDTKIEGQPLPSRRLQPSVEIDQ